MKKILLIVVTLFAVGSVKAQDETQLGYWNRNGFVELTPDESFIYRLIQAMDDESQEVLNDLFTDMKGMRDNSILKRSEGGWYVKKDYPLPEGNYYESDFYKNDNDNGQIYIILPRINVLLRIGYQIEDLLEYYGDKVTLESSRWDGPTDHYLNCHMKSSTEVLEAIGRMYEFMHDGIIGISPDRAYLKVDYGGDLISVLTGGTTDSIVNVEKLIYEMNWDRAEDFISDSPEPEKVPQVRKDEGLALPNPSMQDYIWSPQQVITENKLDLEEHHDYVVRLTLKVPSDGTYYVGLGDWDGENAIIWHEVPVTASDEYQVIDVEFSDFGSNTWGNGFVPLGYGWVVGTSIVKKVEVYEKVVVYEKGRGNETAIRSVKASKADESVYNLAGQKVGASYKGVVIQNGKKRVMK